MSFHHEKCLHTNDNHSKEIKYSQTQPNSTEPMRRFRLDSRTVEPIRQSRSDQLLVVSVPAARTTFGMEVKGSGWETQPADETQAPRAVGWHRRVRHLSPVRSLRQSFAAPHHVLDHTYKRGTQSAVVPPSPITPAVLLSPARLSVYKASRILLQTSSTDMCLF